MAKAGNDAEAIPGIELGEPVRKPAKRAPRKRAKDPAAELPVARVVVDVSLPHLDRPFDYLVPASLAAEAQPGCRVRVRFAGQLVDGYVLERLSESDHDGRLAFIERVVSPEPALTPEIASLAREVADRYAGSLADVLRLAVPPRHARAEQQTRPAGAESASAPAGQRSPARAAGAAESGRGTSPGERSLTPPGPEAGSAPPAADPGPWADYPAGPSLLAALMAGRAPRAVWTAMPGSRWAACIARAAAAAHAGGRGALIVCPDGRDVARVAAELEAELGDAARTAHGQRAGGPRADQGSGERFVVLTAELGPAERYKRWLAVLRGHVRAVVGTRAAMFAPVRDLGLVVIWDDGDDVHAEPHAPYPHAREVLALRAHRAGAGALIGGFARSTDATQLLSAGWARELRPSRDVLRAAAPIVRPVGDDAELHRDAAAHSARLPHVALRAARQALADGPVLIQVPRRGYLPALACARCRTPARCARCAGPLALTSAHSLPYCRWCGQIAAGPEGGWRCPECENGRLRAVVTGARRTAEELGKAFPSVPVRTSGRDGILDRIGGEPALVIATPGAEPFPEAGYTAALLLDGWALLGRADLRAAEEALRRWMNVAALVRPRGEVVVLADGSLPPVQALIRWDPVGLAERELAERGELGFPPVVRMASLTGSPAAVREFLETASLPSTAEVLGPVPADTERERALVRVGRADGLALARSLKAAQGARSARKATETVRVQIDPLELI